ncbi:hypothetical protein ACEK07_45925 [Alcanivoracaceae bacterium MT1]
MNFQYDQRAAIDTSSGGGEYITESCVVRGLIQEAKWVKANSGALGLEISFESESGQKANYLTIYYQKKDGQKNEVGYGQINQIMGCTGVRSLSNQNNYAIELNCKPIAFALERENYRKNDGNDGFRFQIKCIMSANSWLTVAEHASGSGPGDKEYWSARFAQNPKGAPIQQTAQQHQNYYGGQQNSDPGFAPSDDFDQDIPF